VLIRADPGPLPAGPTGWHVDMAFFPDQYESRPRRTYYHMVHACSTVQPGGGAFMIVPGSHRRTYAATEALARTDEALEAFKRDVVKRSGCDPAHEAVEVCPEEGDFSFSTRCASILPRAMCERSPVTFTSPPSSTRPQPGSAIASTR